MKRSLEVITGVGLTLGLAIGTSACSSSVKKSYHKAISPPISSAVPLRIVKGLAVGKKLNSIPVITPTPGMSRTYNFEAKNPNDTEDLVAIYSPIASSFISGISHNIKDVGTALLLTESKKYFLFLLLNLIPSRIRC